MSHNARHIQSVVEAVKSVLTDDLRKPQYRGHENCLAGHCYVASEAVYHLLGGQHSGWVPQNIQHEGGPHWYLKHRHSGAIIDPTASQFETPVPYDKGIGKGFLTKAPSKRARVVLDRVTEKAALEKNRPTPKFPKLGMPDDRRETPIVNDALSLKTKAHALINSQFVGELHDTAKPSKMPLSAPKGTPNEMMWDAWGSNFDNLRSQVRSNYAQQAASNQGSAVALGPANTSYSKGPALRSQNPMDPGSSPAGPASTKLHEDWHLMMTRVQNKYGMQGRQNLVSNMLNDLKIRDPEAHLALMSFTDIRNQSIKGTTHLFDEERVASSLNYLNNPRERELFHQYMRHSPEEAQAFGGLLKRAHRHLQEIGKVVSPIWVLRKPDRTKAAVAARKGFVKSEDDSLGATTVPQPHIPKAPVAVQHAPTAKVHHTETPEFKTWFGNSKVVHPETGKPLRVLHGTTHDFTEFSHKKGNPENWYGRAHYFTDSWDDAASNYARTDGPDLKNRIENETARISNRTAFISYDAAQRRAAKKVVGPAPRTIPVYLKMENPVVVQDGGGTRFDLDEEFDENGEPTGRMFGNGVKLLDALDKVSKKYSKYDPTLSRDAFLQGLSEAGVYLHESPTAHEIESAIRQMDGLSDMQDRNGNNLHYELIRDLWRYAGHDGIIMHAGDQFHFMPGTAGARHYIAFDPRQIKSAVGNVGTFDPKSKDFGKDEMMFEKSEWQDCDEIGHQWEEDGAGEYCASCGGDRGILEGLEKGINGDWSQDPRYRFHVRENPNSYSTILTAYHGRKVVGRLAFSRNPRYDPGSSEHGYHHVHNGDILPEHQGKGLYQAMLDHATKHVQSRGSAGLLSGGHQQSDMSNRVWEKVATHTSTTHDHRDRPSVYFKKDEFTAGAPKSVSCVAIFNSEGFLLMGKRNDTGKWNCPGGKSEPSETPEACARREVWEECGLEIKQLTYLGTGWGGKNGDIKIYAYKAISDDKPTAENDPDKECDEWEWVDVRGGLPEHLNEETLHNGSHDVLLQMLGLQKETAAVGTTELSKSWKHAFIGAMAAASMAGPAMAQDAEEHWTPKGLHQDLLPIAKLESNLGKYTNHAPHSKGEFHTAVGAVGLKPATAHDEYTKSPWLQKVFPDLHDPVKFTQTLKTNFSFYNHVATAHWNRLKRAFDGDVNKAAYAWRWGRGAAMRDAPEVQAGDPYVIAFQKLREKLLAGQKTKHLENPLAKKGEEWLMKAAQRQSFKSKDGIVLPAHGSAERRRYDSNFVAQLQSVFGSGQGKTLKPIKVPIEKIVDGTNMAVNKERLSFYKRVARHDKLPPVIVRRAGNGFTLIDGNHREAAARHVGLRELEGYEIVDEKPPEQARGELPKHLKLYDLNEDSHGVQEPTFRQTKHGMFYEPTEWKDVEKRIKKLGYHGYHGHTNDPADYVTFEKQPKLPTVDEFASTSSKKK